jgi:hypothetical protein
LYGNWVIWIKFLSPLYHLRKTNLSGNHLENNHSGAIPGMQTLWCFVLLVLMDHWIFGEANKSRPITYTCRLENQVMSAENLLNFPATGLEVNFSLTPEKYFKERVNEKISAYTRLSRIYRVCYLVTGSLSIISSAAVPVLINANSLLLSERYATFVSLFVTILVSLERLFRFREYWRNFDFAEEALKREKYLFQARSGEYDRKNDEDAFQLFVKRFEEQIRQERLQTLDDRTRDSSGR